MVNDNKSANGGGQDRRFNDLFVNVQNQLLINNIPVVHPSCQNAFVAGLSNTGSPKPSFLSGSNSVLASPTTSHIILFVSRYLLESVLIFSTVMFFTIFSRCNT